MARSTGISGMCANRSSDLAETVRAGIASGMSCVIDSSIDGDLNPGGTSIRELQGMDRSRPAIGKQ
jgi:thiamine pyrophosphate-dependent acetolactate synthase large subunit-like protein